MLKRGTLGIDIGGTKTLFALFDDKFRVVEEIKIKTEADLGEKPFTKKFTTSVETLMKRAEKEQLQVTAAGIGSAGVVDAEKGTIRECLSIPFLKGYPLRSRLAKLTGANAYLANDVQAGVYGEYRQGAAVGFRHILGFFFGTGLGGAIIIDGKLYAGASGRAGDIGHYMIHSVDDQRSEVLDNLASRTAIAGEAAALATKQQAPHLLKETGTDVREIKSGDLAEAIGKGDRAVEDLVRSRARMAGMAISNLVDFLNPDLILLGGGLVDAMSKLMVSEIEDGIRNHSTSEAAKAVKVTATKLRDHAITTGAARLALDTFLTLPAPPTGRTIVVTHRTKQRSRWQKRTGDPHRLSLF